MTISSREGIKTTIKSCHLILKEVKLYENDHIKYLKLLDNGYTKTIKNKSNHYDNFLITYPNFKNYYRIYCFNVARNIKDNNNNKFFNTITDMESTYYTAYVVLKTHSSVKLEYSKKMD